MDTFVSETMIVDVSASAIDPENDVLTYDYTVTGGVIKGRGPKVQWDLTGVQPGVYTITAGADDGCGVCGKTKSETVTVTECEAVCGLIECPTIDISGPRNVKSGEIEQFTANVIGGSQQSVTYYWGVVKGEIVEGQGSHLIKVRVARKLDSGTGRGAISLTLKIGGLDPRGSCIDSVTKEFENGRVKP